MFSQLPTLQDLRRTAGPGFPWISWSALTCCTDSVLQIQLGIPANMAVLIGNLTGFRCSKLVKFMQCDRIWYHMNSAYYFDGCFSRWDFSRQSRSILPQKRLKCLPGCLLYRLRGHSATCNDCNPRVRASAVTTQPVIWEFFIVIVLYSLSRMQVSSIFSSDVNTHTHTRMIIKHMYVIYNYIYIYVWV